MNENVKKVVARILKDIQVEMSDEFDKNFERQAFFSEKWQRRKSPIRNEGRAILTDTGALRKSIGISIMRQPERSVEEKTANFEKTNEMSGLIQKPIFGCSWL